MNEELKKCPFCGDEAKIDGVDGEKKWINCSNDNCDLSVDWILIEEWNTRPLEDVLIAERDALAKKLEAAKEALRYYQPSAGNDRSLMLDTRIASEALKQLEAE